MGLFLMNHLYISYYGNYTRTTDYNEDKSARQN